jgi:hypothetical protein
MRKKIWEQYAFNITSQSGEDGIIEEIFNRIGTRHSICVEFGAWDGIHFSNTFNLWHNKNWKAILIEGDAEKYKQLVENVKDFPHVRALNVWIENTGKNSLDNILQRESLPEDFDLLSIDIDGDDYYVFESLKIFKPRLILIEFNHTIPLPLEIVQGPGEYFGASAMSLYKLAQSKGYKLCAITSGNLFFIRNDEYEKLNIPHLEIEELVLNDQITHVISAYDGRLFLTRKPAFKNELESSPNYFYGERVLFRIGKFSIVLRKKKERKELNAKTDIELIPIEIITDKHVLS